MYYNMHSYLCTPPSCIPSPGLIAFMCSLCGALNVSAATSDHLLRLREATDVWDMIGSLHRSTAYLQPSPRSLSVPPCQKLWHQLDSGRSSHISYPPPSNGETWAWLWCTPDPSLGDSPGSPVYGAGHGTQSFPSRCITASTVKTLLWYLFIFYLLVPQPLTTYKELGAAGAQNGCQLCRHEAAHAYPAQGPPILSQPATARVVPCHHHRFHTHDVAVTRRRGR